MREKRNKILFGIGLAGIGIMILPWLILGQESVFTYHDQLDGEMVAYILRAKHLWTGSVLPEFLGGADKTALMAPAPMCVLLFLTGHYFGALCAMQLIGSLVAYVGMFLLTKRLTGNAGAAVLVGILYAYLPFLPVYGLSQFGLPMLLWALLQLRDETAGGRRAALFFYVLLFAFNSSLALVGVGLLLVFGIWILADKQRKRFWAAWLILCAGYGVTNRDLIAQLLGIGAKTVSHKAEYVLAAEGFFSGWLNGFLYGGQHSADEHVYFLPVLLVALCLIVWHREEWKSLPAVRALWGGLFTTVLLSGVSAAWNSAVGVWFRTRFGALGAFQLDRLLWLNPCIWYMMLGCSVAVLAKWLCGANCKFLLGKTVSFLGVAVLLAGCVGMSGLQIFKNHDMKSNLQKLRNPDYPAMSYADYYACGVMEQVAEFLKEYTGCEQEAYRVVSLGIDPAAAYYHGFYCVDGYSNNYSLSYKHAFRNVLAPELAKSDYLRAYYDEWGNRCYLFGAECPGYYTIEKNGFYFQNLEFCTEALRDLGAQYLLSAAYIANAQDMGISLLTEEAFETEDSYYRIFIYDLGGE